MSRNLGQQLQSQISLQTETSWLGSVLPVVHLNIYNLIPLKLTVGTSKSKVRCVHYTNSAGEGLTDSIKSMFQICHVSTPFEVDG